jgi:hypothetical protein
LFGQWKLNQDPIHIGIIIQHTDLFQQFFFVDGIFKTHQCRLESNFFTSFYFGGYISFARRVISYQNGYEMRYFFSFNRQLRYIQFELISYRLCGFFPV